MSLAETKLSDINFNTEFNKLINDNFKSVKFNENISIEKSPLGGYGIFYNLNNKEFLSGSETGNEKDIELLRIPNKYTLNIYNCLNHLDEICQDDEESKDIVKKILEYYTSLIGIKRINETNILVSYVIGFYVLKKIGKLNNSNSNSFIKFYLNILLNTKINNLNKEDPMIIYEYSETFKGNSMFSSICKEIESEELIEFTDYINEELIIDMVGNDNDNDRLIKVEELKQIISAVRSRTLEIPKSVEEEEEEEEEEEDFVVDVTLVPILDFANHDNDKLNGYFDVDKETEEILLKLDTNSLSLRNKQENKIEIFISYSKVEDINKFFFNYGFIPKSTNPLKLFEIPFWGYFDKFNNSTKINEIIFKLGQSSNLQFILEYQEEKNIENGITISSLKDVKLNLLDNYSFLALIKNIDFEKYFDFSELRKNETELRDEVNNNREDDNEIEKGTKDREEYDIIGEIMKEVSLEDINKAVYNLVQLVNEYLGNLKEKIKIFQEKMKTEIKPIYSKNLIKYLEFQEEILNKFQELYQERIVNDKNEEFDEYEKGFRMIMDADECEEEWLLYRMKPEYNGVRFISRPSSRSNSISIPNSNCDGDMDINSNYNSNRNKNESSSLVSLAPLKELKLE